MPPPAIWLCCDTPVMFLLLDLCCVPYSAGVYIVKSGIFNVCYDWILLGSGAVCLAHCDGSSTWSEVPLLVKAVTSLSNGSKEGRYETRKQTHTIKVYNLFRCSSFPSLCFPLCRLELHLVGGFNDESKTSHKLSLNILGIVFLITSCLMVI